MADPFLELHPDRVVLLDGGGRACRVCGCTQERACVDQVHGPCWWIEPDLCSHCGEPQILMGEYDRLLLSYDTGAIHPDLLRMALEIWAKKARAALERTIRADVFEL